MYSGKPSLATSHILSTVCKYSPFIAVIAAFAAYLPFTANHFVGDDFFHIAHAARNGLSPGSFLKPITVHFQPVLRAFFALEFSVFGTNAQGYYWINIVLHCFNVAGVVILFTELLSSRFLGFVTGLLFGLSAAHWRITSWITCQGQLLATAMFLIATLLFVYYIKKRLIIFFILSLLGHFFMLFCFSYGFEVPLLYGILYWYLARRPVLSKQPRIIPALLLVCPFVINIMLYFILRDLALPDTPRYNMLFYIGDIGRLLSNLHRIVLWLGAGIYSGYVFSFAGVHVTNIVSGLPYNLSGFLQPSQITMSILFAVLLLLLLDWSRQGIGKHAKLIFILAVWLLITYVSPAIFRLQNGMSMDVFAFSSRYRYLPGIPAAALMVIVLASLKPLCSSCSAKGVRFAICTVFIGILCINVHQLQLTASSIGRQTKAFQQTEERFIGNLKTLVATQNTPVQILDYRFDDPGTRYAGLYVRPSILARIHFTEQELQNILFVWPRKEPEVNPDIPLYGVEMGRLRPAQR